MKIKLRALANEDAARLAHYANNRNIWNKVRDFFPHPYLVSDAEKFIKMTTEQKTNKIFAITIDEGLVGVTGIHPLTDIYRFTAELGYWIAEPYWGQGIATKAVNWITDFTWSNTDIIRIEAGVFEFNPASMKVLEKCGYTVEGIKRKRLIKNDEIYDEHLYAKLRP